MTLTKFNFLSAIVVLVSMMILVDAIGGQEVNITSERHYTKIPGKEGVYAEEVVRVFGAAVEREFRLGVEKVEVLGGKYPGDIQAEQYYASEVVPEQDLQFKSIKADYLEKMKQAILASLPSDGGSINEVKRQFLLQELRNLQSEQKAKESEVWLPHQTAIHKQIMLRNRFANDASNTLRVSLRDEMSLTESQLKKINAISAALKESISAKKRDVEKQIENESEARKQKILEQLDPLQRTKLKNMLGEN